MVNEEPLFNLGYMEATVNSTKEDLEALDRISEQLSAILSNCHVDYQYSEDYQGARVKLSGTSFDLPRYYLYGAFLEHARAFDDVVIRCVNNPYFYLLDEVVAHVEKTCKWASLNVNVAIDMQKRLLQHFDGNFDKEGDEHGN